MVRKRWWVKVGRSEGVPEQRVRDLYLSEPVDVIKSVEMFSNDLAESRTSDICFRNGVPKIGILHSELP